MLFVCHGRKFNIVELLKTAIVTNLGVYIGKQISMEQNARQCAKTCYFHMRRIRQLRRCTGSRTETPFAGPRTIGLL